MAGWNGDHFKGIAVLHPYDVNTVSETLLHFLPHQPRQRLRLIHTQALCIIMLVVSPTITGWKGCNAILPKMDLGDLGKETGSLSIPGAFPPSLGM